MSPALVLVLVVAAAGAFVLFRKEPEAESPRADAPGKEQGFFESLTGGLGRGFGDFFGAVGQGAGAAVGGALAQDEELELFKDASKRHADLARRAIGRGKKTPRHRVHAKGQNLRSAVRDSMEQWAGAAYSALERYDVVSWAVTNEGIRVDYKGLAGHLIKVPPGVQENQRQAWLAEPIVRGLGRYQQAGRGPLPQGGWLRAPFSAFSDQNPFAPRGETFTFLESGLSTSTPQGISPEAQLKRAIALGRQAKKKNAQRGAALAAPEEEA